MNSRQKGKYYENRSKEYLENSGYLVIKSEASKSPFDLIAIYCGEHPEDYYQIRLVQVKSGNSPLDNDFLRMSWVRDKNISDDVIVEIHTWNKGYRIPQVEIINRSSI